MNRITQLTRIGIAIALLPAPLPALHAAEKPGPVKVFVLAGQSNMEGHAVVDIDGKDYNCGKGMIKRLDGNTRRNSNDSWVSSQFTPGRPP